MTKEKRIDIFIDNYLSWVKKTWPFFYECEKDHIKTVDRSGIINFKAQMIRDVDKLFYNTHYTRIAERAERDMVGTFIQDALEQFKKLRYTQDDIDEWRL